jgi:hypothetical protein
MQELFSFKVGGYTIRVADVHVALAAALVMGALAVAAL